MRVTGHFGPKPSRPLDTSAPSHLGPKPSRPHLKINSRTPRPLVTSAPSHLGPIALVISAPDRQIVKIFHIFALFCSLYYFSPFLKLYPSQVQASTMKFRAQYPPILAQKVVDTFAKSRLSLVRITKLGCFIVIIIMYKV